MWGEVSKEISEAREQELRNQDTLFKPVLDKGAIFLRHEHTRESALNVLRHLIESTPVVLQIQRELVLEKKDISETAAAAELSKQLKEQIQKFRQKPKALQRETKEAIGTNDEDEQMRQELEAETNEKSTWMQIIESSHHAAERASAVTEPEYGQEINNLQEQLSTASSAAAEQGVKL